MATRRQLLLAGSALVAGTSLAGCSLLSSTDGEFDFDTVAFTTGENQDYDSYEEQPESTYSAGETVWVLVALEYVPVDADGTATLEYTFETETPEGETWDPVQERDEQWEDVDEDEILIIWEGFSTFEDDVAGEYEMTITVEDQAEGQRLQTTETFTLEA